MTDTEKKTSLAENWRQLTGYWSRELDERGVSDSMLERIGARAPLHPQESVATEAQLEALRSMGLTVALLAGILQVALLDLNHIARGNPAPRLGEVIRAKGSACIGSAAL